mgnify:CR=1 FL=1
MFEMQVKGTFDAAHHLRGYDGKCSRLHGHTWTVALSVRGEALDELGMLVDFKALNQLLEETLAPLDHQDLNALSPFQRVNPTAEHIAKYLYDTLAPHSLFQQGAARLFRVRVWESPHSSVCYGGDTP